MIYEVETGRYYTTKSGYPCLVKSIVRHGQDCSVAMVNYVVLTDTFDNKAGSEWVVSESFFLSRFEEVEDQEGFARWYGDPTKADLVEDLKDLLDNFIGDGTSGEHYLTDRIQEIIDRYRPTGDSKVDWGTLDSIPKMFPPRGNLHNALIDRETLAKATLPLPKGRYGISRVVCDAIYTSMLLDSGHIVVANRSDFQLLPEQGDYLVSTGEPNSDKTTTYTLEKVNA